MTYRQNNGVTLNPLPMRAIRDDDRGGVVQIMAKSAVRQVTRQILHDVPGRILVGRKR
ncbi:hypothetical protein [Atlantibacter hermannii]|uniref:hypothetical protein n=1 Tax=Atlantibacter hermannii TaxID=565 RepID=UPI00289B99AD|nr:hypothetical protein [Atlantibacter hermannii]MCQ4968565.1 hypothetical protein [Enterobacteriaceae bacterium DFI.7.85]